MQKPILSKSTFIRGLQCEKSLYLYKHHYHLRDETPPQLQAIFSQGNKVGLLAQDLFPNGVDASPPDHFKMQKSVFKTQDFIANGERVIYEATFQFNGVIAALDILVKEEDGWKAYEVKSSTKVSDTYIRDAAIQYYAISNSGIPLKDISIIYINNKYVKNGAINVQELFTIESVRDRVLALLSNIPNQVENFKQVIKQEFIPQIDIGPHCNSPYACDFKGHCWKHIPDYSIFNIASLRDNKKFALYKKNIITFNQIDLQNNPLNAKQLLQVKSELNHTSHIDKTKIAKFVNKLSYPLYFLDFETMASAIPIYDNTKPYQQLVFQYSLHKLAEENGNLEHFEYLAEATNQEDPRVGFVKQLINDCGTSGDILVYNIVFERGKLNDLKLLFPEYTNQIDQIINRLKDLMTPFKNQWYYTPKMKGSFSIKAVLPALVPELSYQDLEIKEGGTASTIFTQMVTGEFTGDYHQTRRDLLEYCKMDTYAMVKILEVLDSVSKEIR